MSEFDKLNDKLKDAEDKRENRDPRFGGLSEKEYNERLRSYQHTTMKSPDETKKEILHKIKGLDPDAPIEVHTSGAKQSSSPYRADLLPPLATLRVAEILAYGARKYGDRNWVPLPAHSHLNHALNHLLAFMADDKSDDHAGHAACRIMMWLERLELDKHQEDKPVCGADNMAEFLPYYRPTPDKINIPGQMKDSINQEEAIGNLDMRYEKGMKHIALHADIALDESGCDRLIYELQNMKKKLVTGDPRA